MRVAVVDNYDSFTFNIVQVLEGAGARCDVRRHDEVTPAEVLGARPDGVLLSAGPCTPDEAGICLALVREVLARSSPPLLGVCLGHQCIAQALGGRVRCARRPLHGMLSRVRHDGRGVFGGLEQPLPVARYNSLVVDVATLGDEVVATAWDEDGELMGLRHTHLPLEGVQFHPESHLAPGAVGVLHNWLRTLCRPVPEPPGRSR
jgi:anthranilate synthase/aminodeoxychorismate synthase-like glutamine amidotransferase